MHFRFYNFFITSYKCLTCEGSAVRVRYRPPRRSKVRFAPAFFIPAGKTPFALLLCFLFSNRTRCVGLRFGFGTGSMVFTSTVFTLNTEAPPFQVAPLLAFSAFLLDSLLSAHSYEHIKNGADLCPLHDRT